MKPEIRNLKSESRNLKSEIRKVFFCFFLISGFWLLTSGAVHAQALGGDSKQPLDISADQTLEWHRAQQQYIAKGNAVAKQGAASIQADTLTADYREDEKSKNDIYRITAVGHVILTSAENKAVGDHAVYNLDTGIAVMTGQHLQMTSPDQTVTARDNFIYDTNDDRVDANGAARAVRTMDNGDIDIITADKLSAWFPEDEFTGARALDRLGAAGHVVITTPTDIIHGDHGEYRAGENIAIVTENVRLDHGRSVMTGDRAQLNLDTNVSQMTGNPGQTGRVHGVFYPNDPVQKNPDLTTTPSPHAKKSHNKPQIFAFGHKNGQDAGCEKDPNNVIIEKPLTNRAHRPCGSASLQGL